MLFRSMVIVLALALFALVSACAPSTASGRAGFLKSRVEAARQWAHEMRLTALSVVCDEYRVPGVSGERVQCDVRTLEEGVVPLTCGAYGFAPKCRMGAL